MSLSVASRSPLDRFMIRQQQPARTPLLRRDVLQVVPTRLKLLQSFAAGYERDCCTGKSEKCMVRRSKEVILPLA
jgi:hypothetical protein